MEPLRPIVDIARLLEQRYRRKLDADADEYIDLIVEGGTRVQRLIRDLVVSLHMNTTAPSGARPTSRRSWPP